MQSFKQWFESDLGQQLGPAIGPNPIQYQAPLYDKNKGHRPFSKGRTNENPTLNDPTNPVNKGTHIDDEIASPQVPLKHKSPPPLGDMVVGKNKF